jgi:hypothetical protein
MTSDLNIPDTDIGIALSIILTALLIISKSPNLMKLIDGVAKRIMCIPTMLKIIHLKLRQDVDIVQEIDRQDNDTVRSKLGIPDDVVNCLYEIAPCADGTINREIVIAWIDVVNMIKKNQNEHLKPLEMKNNDSR